MNILRSKSRWPLTILITLWTVWSAHSQTEADSLKPVTFPKYRIERLVHLVLVGQEASKALAQAITETNLAMRAQAKAQEGLALKEEEFKTMVLDRNEWRGRYETQVLTTKEVERVRNKWRWGMIGAVTLIVFEGYLLVTK